MSRLWCSVLTLGASCAVVLAQTAFDREVAEIRLLQTNEVKAELKITQAQRTRMNAAAKGFNDISDKIAAKLEKGQEPTRAEQQQQEREFEKMRTGVLNVLNPTQLRRLREITLQTAGLVALTAPPVAKRLNISSAQSKRIESVFKDIGERSSRLARQVSDKIEKEFKDKKPKDDAERRRLQAQVRKRMDEEMKRIEPQVKRLQDEGRQRVFAVLTQQQRDGWNSLLGKPFNP